MTDDEIDARAREIIAGLFPAPMARAAAHLCTLDGIRAGLLVGKAERDKLAASLAEKDAEIARLKSSRDNHAETMRGARKWLREGDVPRAILWLSDGLSGYTETPDQSLADAIARAEKAEARVAELEGALSGSREDAERAAEIAADNLGHLLYAQNCIRELEAARRTARADALEEAAKVAGSTECDWPGDAEYIARLIRDLKEADHDNSRDGRGCGAV